MSDNPKTPLDYAVRGILAGAGVGSIAGIIGIFDLSRGLFLGMLCGALAGLTIWYRRNP